eukprot:6212385-Pleurochrysis_carterae.AAC.2
MRSGQSRRTISNADRQGLGAIAGAGAGTRQNGGSRKVAQWAAAAITSELIKSLGIKARALR